MFDVLSERLQKAFRTLRGHGHLTETEIREGLREIRLALLEADVHVKVVKELIERVRERSNTEDILRSLTPGQQIVKIVRDQMTEILAQGTEARLRQASRPPTVILMTGLQGSGKTTTAAKLARWSREQGRSPLLVAADVRRPAAVDQLRVLGEQIGVPVESGDEGADPVGICRMALKEARQVGRDPVIIDTAGRLHIDDELMAEITAIRDVVEPTEILYVADAMTGQDAVRSARAFHEQLVLTGAILSKADGDARGGAALSLRHVTGVPIKFVGTGEHVENLEPFQPERMVSRILGMGDVLSLIEKVETIADRQEAQTVARRMRRNELTLEDLADQLEKVGRMGSLREILGMLPGAASLQNVDLDEGSLVRTRAMIGSMTGEERRRPDVINGSRRLRIARGSGTSVPEVNTLLKQFRQMKKMMKSMSRGRGGGALGRALSGSGRFSPR
ncbi:MAG: signal recognition particle protein [Acidobacteriota bacterium]